MAWKKLAFTDEMLTNPMTADLNMADYDIIDANNILAKGTNESLYLVGGNSLTTQSHIQIEGSGAAGSGQMLFNISNGAGATVMAAGFEAGTTTPRLMIQHGLDMSTKKITSLLAGTAAADAIRKDQALLLNGTQAMTAALDMNDNNIEDMCALKAHDALGIAVFDSGDSDRIVLCPTGYGFLTNAPVDMNKQEIEAMCFENLASAPAAPGAAQIYYDTVDDHLYVNVV